MKPHSLRYHAIAGAVLIALLTACSSDSGDDPVDPLPAPAPTPSPTKPELPQLSEATPAMLKGNCADLAGFSYPAAVITSATLIDAGVEMAGPNPIGAHCRVTGKLEERVSPVDNNTYAIGFEMRLPVDWSGRYFYQGNGGVDGTVSKALGVAGSGGALTNALYKGFAVMSSDAGHGSPMPTFGLDPEARINYGYGAAQKLTPLSKKLIEMAYGKGPDRSYFGGNSNGGRHTMVAAARLASEYDGFLASDAGFNLPRAAATQLWSAQKFLSIATDPNDLNTAFTLDERKTVANAILAKCDALDGVKDGLVQDLEACRGKFNLFTDVPSCSGGNRDGSCLTPQQKTVIDEVFKGPRNSKGEEIYTSQPYDPGIIGSGWVGWKFGASVSLDPGAVGVIWTTPPDLRGFTNGRDFALNYNLDTDFPKLFATDPTYTAPALSTETAESFMTPPHPTKLDTLRDRGAKLLVIHGATDGVFSIDDTRNWYEGLMKENDGDASKFARFFRVPSMGHGSGGPSTDQFDALQALIEWVEHGTAPDRIIAQARGPGNPGGVNTEVPTDWAPDRTRPLCPYPLVARYNGSGDIERAENFSCQK